MAIISTTTLYITAYERGSGARTTIAIYSVVR